MKTDLLKSVLVLFTLTFYLFPAFGQSPDKMSYQAVIRNSNNQLVSNQTVGMQISILQGSASGTVVYVETQTPITNANGLVSIEIGGGTSFSTINWANGPYFIKTETDPSGGTSYSITGTSQLLSVPYALHANTAETVTGGIIETDPVFTAWDKSTGISITESQISDLGTYIESETDPVFTAWDKSTGISITESQISDLGTYIETETDPIFSAWDKSTGISITESQISDLGTYIETETDPTVPAHVKAITTVNVSDWNEAHGWGDHSMEGYATKDMNSEKITNLANPTDAQDAATKAYVDVLKAYVDVLLARIETLEEKDLLNHGFIDSRDGNHYNVVKIGNQVWMAENLKYLPSVVGPGTGSGTTPCYYVYDYDGTNVTDAKSTANYTTYGVLYNWAAAMNGAASSATNPSGVQGVCPTGWHLPSDAEWIELIDYLGGTSVAGGKLKEIGTTHWRNPNTGATNESGYTGLPGGLRSYEGPFFHLGYFCSLWSATGINANFAWLLGMAYDSSSVSRGAQYKEAGLSVRCLRD